MNRADINEMYGARDERLSADARWELPVTNDGEGGVSGEGILGVTGVLPNPGPRMKELLGTPMGARYVLDEATRLSDDPGWPKQYLTENMTAAAGGETDNETAVWGSGERSNVPVDPARLIEADRIARTHAEIEEAIHRGEI